jgi:hypothetical protein
VKTMWGNGMGSVAHAGTRVCLVLLGAGCGLYDSTLINRDDHAASMPDSENNTRRRKPRHTVVGIELPPSAAGGMGGLAGSRSGGLQGGADGPLAGAGGASVDLDAGTANEIPVPELSSGAQCGGRQGYVAASGHCYVPLPEVVSWYMARDLCAQRKGHLAAITSKPEQRFVASIPRQEAVWIGLSKFGSPSYGWVTGEVLSFVAWQTGAPSTRSEGGALLDAKTGTWLDAPPSQSHPALCELEAD